MSDTQDAGFVTREEQEVARDEAAVPELTEDAPAPEEEPEPDKTEYLEFVGTQPYGTEFTIGHSVSKAHLKKYHDVVTPKDLEWTKGSNGRFLVPISDISPEAVEVLVNDPQFKRVKL